MKRFGLIGFPLAHSFSKKYFEEKFTQEKIDGHSYDLFPLHAASEVISLVKTHPDIAGLNVTIPYKESVMEYLAHTDEVAEKVGAVNCIKVTGGNLTGYNTDVYGFEESLKKFLNTTPQQAFILGTGGSAKAVAYVLEKLNIPFIKVSRHPDDESIGYSEVAKKMQPINLFINTTPLGMHPHTEAAADIPYKKLSKHDYLFDLIYNPEETLFLKKGKEHKAHTKNGLEMLHLQADKSWEIWNK